MTGAPGDERALASAVLALLVPEVPVALWAAGELALASMLMHELADAADRLFFDSAEAGDCCSAWSEAVALQHGHDLELCDLTWWRMEIWRSLLAQLFDRPDAWSQLAQLASIEIECAGESAPAEALLIAGWLMSRLGLTLADVDGRDGGIQATLYDASRGVRLTVSCSGAGTRVVSAVRVRTDGASFIVEAHEESGHMHVREEWPDHAPSRTVARPADDDASVFASALDGGDDPAVFLDAVTAALSILGHDASPTGNPPRPA